jgi:hypothetical protein
VVAEFLGNTERIVSVVVYAMLIPSETFPPFPTFPETEPGRRRTGECGERGGKISPVKRQLGSFSRLIPAVRTDELRDVQAHRHHCGCHAGHSPAASHLCGAVAKGIAGFLRIQEADRLSGMGDLVRYRLCFRLFGRKPDSLHVEMTLHEFHKKVATMAPDIELN